MGTYYLNNKKPRAYFIKRAKQKIISIFNG